MMSEFTTELCAELIKEDKIWKLTKELIYWSDLLDSLVTVPEGFETDLASVPRLPIAYTFWGGKAHREGVLHDYLYRIDAEPAVSFDQANSVFLEAMEARGKSRFIRWPMYAAVCLGGRSSYHQKKVGDSL